MLKQLLKGKQGRSCTWEGSTTKF